MDCGEGLSKEDQDEVDKIIRDISRIRLAALRVQHVKFRIPWGVEPLGCDEFNVIANLELDSKALRAKKLTWIQKLHDFAPVARISGQFHPPLA